MWKSNTYFCLTESCCRRDSVNYITLLRFSFIHQLSATLLDVLFHGCCFLPHLLFPSELCYLFGFKWVPPTPAFPPLLPSVVFFVCLASNSPNPSWVPFMKMQIHSRAGENVNRRKLLRSTNQKRRAIKNRQQQPGDPNSVQPPPEIATHACINPLQAKNMWLKERCCHLLQGTSLLEKGRSVFVSSPCAVWSLTHTC